MTTHIHARSNYPQYFSLEITTIATFEGIQAKSVG
jgi:hypothetical protein